MLPIPPRAFAGGPSTPVPRMLGWLAIAVLLIVAVWAIAPQQLPVTLYKASLVSLAGVVGYWLDRSLFPYARPDELLARWRLRGEMDLTHDEQAVADGMGDAQLVVGLDAGGAQAFAAAMIRRALIVAAAMLAMGLGA